MNMCCFMNFSLVLQTVNFMERNMNVVLDKLQKFQVIFHHEQFKKIYVILSFWVSFLVWIVESCGVKPFERTLLRISKAFQTSFKIFLLRKSFQNYGFSKLSTLYETLVVQYFLLLLTSWLSVILEILVSHTGFRALTRKSEFRPFGQIGKTCKQPQESFKIYTKECKSISQVKCYPSTLLQF